MSFALLSKRLLVGLSVMFLAASSWAQEENPNAKKKGGDAPKTGFGSGISSKESKDSNDSKEEPKITFGVDRKESKKGEKAEKARPSKDEIEKRKQLKVFEKRLGREEDGFFVIELQERKFEAPQVPMGQPVNPRVRPRWVPVDSVTYIVLEGRQTAAEYLLDYMSEFAPDPKEKRSRRSSKQEPVNPDEPPSPPDPLRDWKPIGRYETNEEATFVEQQLKERRELLEERQKQLNKGY